MREPRQWRTEERLEKLTGWCASRLSDPLTPFAELVCDAFMWGIDLLELLSEYEATPQAPAL